MFRKTQKKFKVRVFLYSREAQELIVREIKMRFIPPVGMNLVLDHSFEYYVVPVVQKVLWDEVEPRCIDLLCGLLYKAGGERDGELLYYPYGLLPGSICDNILKSLSWNPNEMVDLYVADILTVEKCLEFDPHQVITTDHILKAEKKVEPQGTNCEDVPQPKTGS